jgi:hypothetical protein
MLAFLAENWGTIVVGLVVAGIVAAIIVKIIRDKRKGKSVVCDCSSCEGCHGGASCGAKK